MADNNNVEQRELTAAEVNEQRQIKRDKLEALREMGRDPFVEETFDVTAHSKDIKDNFDAIEDQEVAVAGRIMAFRRMGKVAFVDMQDKQGRIQIFVARDNITADEYQVFKTYDVGDIIGVNGVVFRTKTGEISVRAEKVTLLCKSLQVLPNKWQGLKDVDMRYRQRYVDLIMNEDVRDTFRKRAKIISTMRRVLEEDYDLLEVETPVLGNIAGGAAARPFLTHHNTLDIDMTLRISLELHLKRLIVGGLDGVYEIGKVFRNEGMDKNHSPEFTSMEAYKAYVNLETMMDLMEQVVYKCAMEVNGTPIIKYGDKEFDVTPPWNKIDMTEAVIKVTGIPFDKIDSDEEAIAAAKAYGMHFENESEWTRGKLIAEMFEDYCEDIPGFLDGPCFVCGHPLEISPLAKKDPKDPRLTRRFESYINGWEISNAFSELNDPIDQYERFAEQQRQLDCGIDDEAHPMDTDYVNALEVGLPPTGGIGIGVDRLVMLLTDSATIRDVQLFPTMKPEGKGGSGSAKSAKKESKEDKLTLTRDQALELLKKYNSDPFHIRHGLTVEAVMRWYANELGYADEAEFWGQVGLLHDIDFELYPEEHCQKAPELLKEGGASDALIHGVVSHGYGLVCDVEPEHEMEKVLFAADELTGLIWSYALMRGKTCEGMEVSGLKKKFKDKKFAAGCSRDVIKDGAERLGWELTDLFDKTIKAMQASEKAIDEACGE